MSDLRMNKIFGAFLATGLVILGLRQVSDMIFTAEPPEEPGYHIEVQEEAIPGAPVVEPPPDWGTVLPAADLAAGETTFAKCVSCHTANQGGAELTGPNLFGVVGRQPATHGGYPFSQAMINFGQEQGAWDYQTLYDYLHAPQQHVRGTKMTFIGLKQRQEKINMIAWLRAQSANPAPIPPPNPALAQDGGAEGGEATAEAAGDGEATTTAEAEANAS